MGKKKKRNNRKKHSTVVIERYNRMKKNTSKKNDNKTKTKKGDWISTLIVILIIAIITLPELIIAITTLPELIQNVRQQAVRDKHLEETRHLYYSDWGSHQKEYTEIPAFAPRPDFYEYTLEELTSKSEEEKRQILSGFTSAWDDIWSETLHYAIVLGQKLQKKNNYNKERDFGDFVQYHLYDVMFKMANPNTFDLMCARLEKENYDLYREQALLVSFDDIADDLSKETYELYDKFVTGDYSLPYSVDKRAFVYAWRVYNGYDGYESATPDDLIGYYYFKVEPSGDLQDYADKYAKELDKAYELQKWGDSLETSSDADWALSDISDLSNIEQEKLYHSITGHWYGHRDYELFAKYRVAVAQQAKKHKIDTEKAEFLDYLNQIRAFNYKIAFWRVSQKGFNKNMQKETELLKNFADKYEYEN